MARAPARADLFQQWQPSRGRNLATPRVSHCAATQRSAGRCVDCETLGTGRLEGLAEAAFTAGDKAASDRYLKDTIALHGQRGPYWIAEAYEYRGERDQAIDWLNQAYDRHDSQLVMLKDDPMLSGMRDDPRFKEFLRKINFSE